MEFCTTNYQWNYGRSPRGRGSWAFKLRLENGSTQEVFSPSMTYGDAKRWCKKNHPGALSAEVLT